MSEIDPAFKWAIRLDLLKDEGLRKKPYKDSKGNLTICIGHHLDKPISSRAVEAIFEDDLQDAIDDLDRVYPWWRELSLNRRRALANMCFQMGLPKFSGFKKMLAAMQDGDFFKAAMEARDSDWAKQTAPRAQKISYMIEDG